MKKGTRCSVIVATYNQPDALALSLRSLFQQSRLPDEIVICDDGSRDETRQCIEQLRAESPVPLRHVWQPDEGFQLAKIRNKGIAIAEGEYIVQIDCDIIAHRHFVRDHLRNARRGSFFSGNRFLLSPESTAETYRQKRLITAGTPLKQNLHRLRLPLVQSLMANYYRWDKYYLDVQGCNMAFWRDDLIAVNGYDERMVGYGGEDLDLSLRLINLGRQLRLLRFGGIEFHLHHKEVPRDPTSANAHLALQQFADGVSRCEFGLDQYLKASSPT